MMRRVGSALPALLLGLCYGTRAFGAPATASASASGSAIAAPPASGAPPAMAAPATPGACVEQIPEGKQPPKLTETVSDRATSGHALVYKLVVEHGPGETVLPSGFSLQTGSDEYKALEAAHLFLPDPAGGLGPKLTREKKDGRATTTMLLHFVPLPDKPGRNELVLPSLPIAVSRASGELMTLCTAPHRVRVEDPIANLPDPKPKQNPAPRRQLEEWTAAKQVTIAALIAAAVGALVATLFLLWRRLPRSKPPGPPPRPPWDVALEALFDLRHAGLVEQQRLAELYDRVSDIVRRYLGERYGYDGLESTTREALSALRNVPVDLDAWVMVQQFMHDADLVKFARRTPTEAECTAALSAAEAIVARTRPAEQVVAQPAGAAGSARPPEVAP